MLFLALPLGAEGRPEATSIHVRDNAEFQSAVAALRYRGGTIHLRRHVYRGELVVSSRSRRPLRIVGERGVIVESLLLDHTQHVTVKHVTIKPVTDDGWLKIYHSKHIALDHVLVTAEHTRLRATVHIPNSSHEGATTCRLHSGRTGR